MGLTFWMVGTEHSHQIHLSCTCYQKWRFLQLPVLKTGQWEETERRQANHEKMWKGWNVSRRVFAENQTCHQLCSLSFRLFAWCCFQVLRTISFPGFLRGIVAWIQFTHLLFAMESTHSSTTQCLFSCVLWNIRSSSINAVMWQARNLTSMLAFGEGSQWSSAACNFHSSLPVVFHFTASRLLVPQSFNAVWSLCNCPLTASEYAQTVLWHLFSSN